MRRPACSTSRRLGDMLRASRAEFSHKRAGPRLAARGADHAGDRQGAGCWRRAREDLLREAADDLVAEAMGTPLPEVDAEVSPQVNESVGRWPPRTADPKVVTGEAPGARDGKRQGRTPLVAADVEAKDAGAAQAADVALTGWDDKRRLSACATPANERLGGLMTAAARDAPDDGAYAMQTIGLGGTELVADASGALYWPSERALIVADLHFEKGSAFARRGVFLPPYDTRETLARLTAVVARFAPATIVALGDSFHDAAGPTRLGDEERADLAALQRGRTWVWIDGNHDAAAAVMPGGERCEALVLGGLALRHEPSSHPSAPEIAGHLHPAARVALRGATLRRPCFAAASHRLVMPAFGAFTGGLNVLSEPFAPLFPGELSVWLIGARGVYPAARHALRPD